MRTENADPQTTTRRRSLYQRGLGRTLFGWFLMLALVPMVIMMIIGYGQARQVLRANSELALKAVAGLKAEQIEAYFNQMLTDLNFQASTISNIRLIKRLARAFRESDYTLEAFSRSDIQLTLSAKKGADLTAYRDALGYNDIYLIDTAGNVVFSVGQGDILGTNLFEGPRGTTRFSRACGEALQSGNPVFSDFEVDRSVPRAPVLGYLVAPIEDDQVQTVGLFALEFTTARVDTIMQGSLNLGRTAETYLIGPDLKLRSNSNLAPAMTVLETMIDTDQTRLWYELLEVGQQGADRLARAFIYSGPHGKQVFGIHRDLRIQGVTFGMIAEIETAEAFAAALKLRQLIMYLLPGTCLLVIILASLISRRMVRPINALSTSAKQVAEGNLEASITVKTRNEIGELADCFNLMVSTLRHQEDENQYQTWLKTGQTELNEKLRGEPDMAALGNDVVGFLCRFFNANSGAFYVAETGLASEQDSDSGPNHDPDSSGQPILSLTGSYAFVHRKHLSNRIAWGEGLVGQAALERQPIVLSDCPEEYMLVSSGLGSAPARHILVFPIVLENTVKGVVELGAFEPFDERRMHFLELVSESIAIGLASGASRRRNADLLEQTKQQAQILHDQQENLQQANQELEEQTEALQESEARLQAQQEELRQTNEELHEQARALKDSEARLQAQQEELRQINEELQDQSRKLEVQQEKTESQNLALKKAQRLVEAKANELENSSKYKSEFLANMSHELRTPLNSILLLSRLMADNKDGGLKADDVESAQSIYSSGSDLLALINEILDLSKVEAGKLELHLGQMHLQEFSLAMERLFKPLADQKGLDLIVDVGEDLPATIYSDRQRVEQVIKNFLSNAFKFTQRGRISLKLFRAEDTDHVSGPQSSIALAVSDTGIGVAHDKQQAIFEAFQQEDGTISRKYGGTGLGLSISRELAKLLGGRIRMQSQHGQGSTFTLYLPEKYAPQAKMSAQAPLPAVGETPPPVVPVDPYQKYPEHDSDSTGRTASVEATAPPASYSASDETADGIQAKASTLETPPLVAEQRMYPEDVPKIVFDDRKHLTPEDRSILIIDDDPAFLKILRDLAREQGFKCVVAESGETGLQFADYYEPDAIILDLGLPGIDGWVVLDRLKEQIKTRHIPIHIISGSDKKMAALKMGAVDFLTKPAAPEGLARVFGRLKQVIDKPVKDLLVVEDNPHQVKAIVKMIGNHDVQITSAATAGQAFAQVKSKQFDCMIMDLGLPDMSGLDLLSKIRDDEDRAHLPVVIYTGKELTAQQKAVIDEYAESTIIKGANSQQKLLDETSLFLHRVESSLPAEQRQILKMVHDKETIFAEKKVMVVDDDMRNVFSLKKVLQEKGMQVVIGKNGREGLACLEENPNLDLVLMDIMMPEMDGYEAMRAIRKQDRFKKLPVIALTAKAMKGDRAKCIEAGASDYLAKPVDMDRLFSMLRVWLY